MSRKEFYKQISKCLKDMCIELMAMGMSYSDYWFGDLEIADYYIEAYRQKSKKQMLDENRLAHRVGFYFAEAYCSLWSKTPKPYPSKPYEMTFEDDNFSENDQQRKADEDMKNYLRKKGG